MSSVSHASQQSVRLREKLKELTHSNKPQQFLPESPQFHPPRGNSQLSLSSSFSWSPHPSLPPLPALGLCQHGTQWQGASFCSPQHVFSSDTPRRGWFCTPGTSLLLSASSLSCWHALCSHWHLCRSHSTGHGRVLYGSVRGSVTFPAGAALLHNAGTVGSCTRHTQRLLHLSHCKHSFPGTGVSCSVLSLQFVCGRSSSDFLKQRFSLLFLFWTVMCKSQLQI